MKLTKSDKEFLLGWGYKEDDFAQIERAASKTTYELDGKKISRSKTIELLGRERYLSGIGRSAFHWTAFREVETTGSCIFFDSSNYDFKKKIKIISYNKIVI